MTNKIIIMNFRIEKDTMGEVQVPAEKYWGAQTESALETILKSVRKALCPEKS